MTLFSSLLRLSAVIPKRKLKFTFLAALYVIQSSLEIVGLSSIIAVMSGALSGENNGFVVTSWIDLEVALSTFLFFAITALFLKGLVSVFCTYYQTHIAYSIQARLMTSMANSFLKRRLAADEMGKGLRQILIDSQQVAGGFSALGNLCGELVIFMVLLAFLATIDPYVAAALVVAGTALVAFLDTFFKPRVANLGRRRQLLDDAKVDNFMNIALGASEIKIFGVQQRFLNISQTAAMRFAEVIARYAAFQVGPKRIIEFGSFLGVITLFGWASLTGGVTSESQFELFATVGLVLLRLMPSVTRLMHTLTVMRYTTPVFIDFAQRLAEGSEINRDLGSFRSVDSAVLEYMASSAHSVSNCRFELKNSGLVWVRGDSGAGKTTFLLALADYLIQEKKCSVGWVGQQPVTIPGDLVKNIAFFRVLDEPQLAQAREYASELGLMHLVDRTDLGHVGQGISGGEAQRLSIIRALISSPAKLMLDEPTSGLDAENVAIVLTLLKKVSKIKQVFIISHDDRLGALADQEIVIVRV